MKDLLKQAYTKLDSNDFVGAREDYRKAVMLDEPDGDIIHNLNTAEQEEKLEFFRNLRAKYPNSFSIRLSEANYLAASQYKAQAIDRYSEMLELFGENLKDHLIARLNRLGTACRDNVEIRQTLIINDFQSIWTMGDQYEPARKLRPTMLRMLANELHKEECIPILEELVGDRQLPVSIRELFEAKIVELHYLSKAIEDIMK
jgi:hypothetical protein